MPTLPDEITSTTQKYLDIFDITNDLLINKDGSTALIIKVNAMNFGLLAEAEQDAIIYAYAGLLNSLNYPIQILIRSQTKDVTNYLNLLKNEEESQVSDTKRQWISDYREFVADLIQERNVLDKKFYVVIPASALEMGLLPPSTVVPGVKAPDLTSVERSAILEKAKEILEPKRDHLISQFARIGLYGRQLATQEIIQLFYLSYNPEAQEGQQITDTNSYTTPLVTTSTQGGYMDNVQVPNLNTQNSNNTSPMDGSQTPSPSVTPPTPSMPVTPEPEPTPQPTPSPIAPTMPEPPTPVTPPMAPSTPPTPMTPPTPVMPAATPPTGPQPLTPENQAQIELEQQLKALGDSGVSASPSPTPTTVTTPITPMTPPAPVGSPAPSIEIPATPMPGQPSQPNQSSFNTSSLPQVPEI